MQRRPTTIISFLVVLLTLSTVTVASHMELVLTDDEIPVHLSLDQQRFFSGSDSLYLNGQLLSRDTDFSWDESLLQFDLSRLKRGVHDTLLVTYEPLPDWISRSYGRALPPPVPRTTAWIRPEPSSEIPVRERQGTDINITGAKSFQFTARSTGASSFSQSLDLRLRGELSSGVEISGAISDRGYSPSYGPVNSRLNELDRINLRLRSSLVQAQVGDIVVAGRLDIGPPRSKRVTGAGATLQTSHWYVQTVAARPKGTFHTQRLTPLDGLQGPYQVGEGTAVRPIVPGSEQVWLDGRQLLPGSDKDYTIDYPTGRITFSAAHPIDRRSRIEVDYEPRETDYRGELYSLGGGASIGDSTFFVAMEYLREGDDHNLPVRGDLSDLEKDILAAAGDSSHLSRRSGATPDSSGNYLLEIDSLPDSVYRYAGEDTGDDSLRFRIHFSYVGAGEGDYRFLGGDRYEFIGRGLGDYLPVVVVPIPTRTDYYRTRFGLRHHLAGEVTAEIRQTVYDRNLFSDRDDQDNRGAYYLAQAQRQWQWHDQPNHYTFKTRHKEARFHSRGRLYAADFHRRFLLPDNDSAVVGDESLHQFDMTVSPMSALTLSPRASRLEYSSGLTSLHGGADIRIVPHRRLETTLTFQATSTASDHSTESPQAQAKTYGAGMGYRPLPQLNLRTEYEHDQRENDYSGEPRGTRYQRSRLMLESRRETLAYEYFSEDSLTDDWLWHLSRHRLSAGANRRMGNLTGNVRLTNQWLLQTDIRETSFLGQLHLSYDNLPRRLQISTSYTLSEETRHARGVTYLEVEPGQGHYILEDGAYLPDQDGNYIRAEEILSGLSRVSRGEKSFQMTKDFKVALVRCHSAVREELLAEGRRSIWWLLPFFSDNNQPYLYYSRRYDFDLHLIRLRGSHVVNITLSEDREQRSPGGGTKERYLGSARLIVRQTVKNTYFSESLELFESERDEYFTGGGRVRGYKSGITVKQQFSSHEVSTGGSYRRATTPDEDKSEIYALQLETRLRTTGKAHLRASVEFYYQHLTDTTAFPSFLLTGNRLGKRGAVWSVELRYGLKDGLRCNLSASGRHSDDRRARVTARGEMVAGF
ncbi:MAG: hypothetical protein ABII79_04435 [bacterium]